MSMSATATKANPEAKRRSHGKEEKTCTLFLSSRHESLF